MSWPEIQAGEIMVKRGGSVNPAKFPKETFDLFSIPAFDRNEFDILLGGEIGSSKAVIAPNDVLISKIIPHIRRCQVVPKTNANRQIGSGEWIIFRSPKHDPNFLRHFLVSDKFHNQFMNTVAGMGGSLVRARPAAVAEIKIPLPPLDKQKRVAGILDKAEGLRRKRARACALTNTLLRSIFLDMFGDPVTNPMGWEVGTLDSFSNAADRINYGVIQPGKDFPGGIPLIRSGDIGKMFMEAKNLKLINPEVEKSYSRSRLVGDEILISCVGSIGEIGLIGVSQKGFNIARAVARVRVNEKLNRVFAAYMLKTNGIQNYFSRETRTVAQPTLNIKQIKNAPIIIPPLTEQEKFASFVTATKATSGQISKSGSMFVTLTASLTQRAFNGELTG